MTLSDIPRWRLLGLLILLTVGTFATALGNGWAYDDVAIVPENDVVTGAQWERVFHGPYWHGREVIPALYRPTTIAAFTLEWSAFGDRPAAFHAVNLLIHAANVVLVVLIGAEFLPLLAAVAGGAVFAVHPVHVEAVANVVGQSELIATLAYLGACLLYVAWRPRRRVGEVVRTLGLAALYALALGAKEVAATLPAVLLLLGRLRRGASGREGSEPLPTVLGILRRDLPLQLLLFAVLAGYLGKRLLVLGSVAGDAPSPELLDLSMGERIMTGLSLWPTYLRLFLFPLDLSSDYGPGVLSVARGLRADVLFGSVSAVILSVVFAAGWKERRLVALPVGWWLVTILPVSNLLVPMGTLLAERTLYLPSVSLSLAVAVLVGAALEARLARGLVLGWALAFALVALAIRTTLRIPAWLDTYTVLSVLAVEHPESWLSHRSRANGLLRVGQTAAALREFDTAIRLQPNSYALLVEAGTRYKEHGLFAQARPLLERAIRMRPDRPMAYRSLAETRLREGDGRSAYGIALAGLARWGPDHDLWGLVSESYVAKGDLTAAIRAREAASAFALPADTANDGARLRELRRASAALQIGGDAR